MITFIGENFQVHSEAKGAAAILSSVFRLVLKPFQNRNRSGGHGAEERKPRKIPSGIKDCEKKIKEIFHDSSDIVVMSFGTKKEMAMIVYVDGLADKDLMDRDIVAPIKSDAFDGDILFALKVTAYKVVDDLNAAVGLVLDGNAAVFYEGLKKAVVMDLKNWKSRSVETPDSEAVIRGPKEGFTESVRVNTSMLRRKVKTPDLVVESLSLGRQTHTLVALAYIRGIVNEDVLRELKSRLSKIDTGSVLESGYIEQYIEADNLSAIPTVGLTQKPDIAAAKILEGRVAVLCDGTPHVITVPHLFIENIQNGEDYYNRTPVANTLRLIRVVALSVSVLLPGLFVAAVNFDQEMIPTVFLITLASAREAIPLPASIEMFFMMLMFELLRESGTRLPRPIGSAISIVGALIIGDAAVKAGIVGAPAVIVIAITAVASFIVPTLTEFMTIYRFLFWLLGSLMGIIGIGSGILFMAVNIVSARSLGIPMLSSFSKQELKDDILRFPLRFMAFRPRSVAGENRKRHKSP